MSILAHLGLTLLVFLLLIKALKKDIRGYDLRLVAFGSLLPDLIDKPLAIYGISPGRGYAHTLIFMLAILLISYGVGRYEVAFGNLLHLSFDFIFLEPKVFLWPLFGMHLDGGMYTFSYYWERIFTSRFIFVTENLGFLCMVLIIIWYRLYRFEELKNLIIRGRICL